MLLSKKRHLLKSSQSLRMFPLVYIEDIVYALIIILMIYNIVQRGSCAGVSFKTQSLYALVMMTRFLGTNSIRRMLKYRCNLDLEFCV